MDERQVYSNTVNVIGDDEVSLRLAWHDTILVGIGPRGGVSEKSWVSQGEFLEIDGRRWLLVDVRHAAEEADAKIMLQLVAVE